MKSSLTSYTRLSPNYHAGRYYNGTNWNIDTITIHHVVGQASVESLGAEFAKVSRRASSNYGVGYDGKIGCYVEEENRSLCSSSGANDARAITIEVADEPYEPYKPNAAAYESLINLLVDIVKRNPGLGGSLRWVGDKNVTDRSVQNMTIHRWFASTSCPGTWLLNNMGEIAKEVNLRLKAGGVTPAAPVGDALASSKIYKVQAGAFAKLENAASLQQKLKEAGFNNTFITPKGSLHTVQVGAYKQKGNATTTYNKLKKAGFDAFIYEG